ncbi:MAG: hypothetical protein KIS78_04470, partial [Labilithrix sp.]|nr:hypothetical protein [Labilithrix sp.]
MEQTEILGWGTDATVERRPGVPEERRPPEPLVDAIGFPSRQTTGTPSVTSPHRPLTAVYGTAVPLRGLSGLVRRAAYRAPDYEARRWALLKLADKIDVLEHSPLRVALGLGAVA